ncbi:MAG: ABC transporter permease [Chloroflexota bacterium]|nr:ABC transporter permease [Chloroflexota bacterium]
MSSSPSRISGTLLQTLGSIAAVVIALLLGAVVIWVSGNSAREAYLALIDGAFNGRRALAETLVYSAPLILGGLAFAVAFRAGMFNIGIEGQLVVGGFAAGLIAALDLGLPAVLHLPLGLLAAMIAGGVWAGIAGGLKAVFGAHEVISTIMLNYLAFRLIFYLIQRAEDWLPVQADLQATERAVAAARLPRLLDGTRLHAGIIVAVVGALILWYLLFRTTFGYSVRTVGLSRGAAAYGGINWRLTITLAMVASGMLAGLAGASESLGLHGRHYAEAPGYGFTSIAVGLVGRNHPLAVVLSGLLFGALSSGAPSMQADAGVSAEIVQVLQGLVILAVAAFAVMNRLPFFRTRSRGRAGQPTAMDRASMIGMEPEVETRMGPPSI